MLLLTDSWEKDPLTFAKVEGVTHQRLHLAVGDYTAEHNGIRDTAICERKSLSDLFTSFTGNYDAERDKIRRAKELGLTYILAIEGTFSELLKGHSYYAGGEWHVARKTGIAMARQLMTLQRKYGITVWFCESRQVMAMMMQEYFLAQERVVHVPSESSESRGEGFGVPREGEGGG